ncbi:MAG: serine hydrolase, partial [Ktedonobacterales bacterium]
APDGWQTDFGDPLSEALPVTASVQGSVHHLLVQVFWRGIVVEDRSVTDADGDPVVTRLDTGVAYLRTFGPPSVMVRGGTPVWGLADAAALTAPDSGRALAHVGLNFPFTATGETRWTSSGLWYHVRWKTSHSQGDGWMPAIAVTFSTPPAGSPWLASFDALSPDLANYLNSQGPNASVVVYDLTRGQYYTYNAGSPFIMASSAKVPIMLTFLTMTESQSREPDDNEMYLLTTMIENSDNNSAQALFDEICGAPAMANFLSSVGVGGIAPDPDAWGYSTTTPMAMVQLLTMLQTGKVLTAQDRGLAFNLMENIQSDQQTGVGDTAPAGATVALKDGWVPGPDNLWAMNSSGIVTLGSETYIIAVYTQEQNQLQDGWTITQHVCGGVGQLLA